MSEIIINQANNGSPLNVHQNDKIHLHLSENPTTGFRWAIQQVDEAILKPEKPFFFLAENIGIGAGGYRVFTFQAQKTGIVHINMIHWREWEGLESIIERFTITIYVQN